MTLLELFFCPEHKLLNRGDAIISPALKFLEPFCTYSQKSYFVCCHPCFTLTASSMSPPVPSSIPTSPHAEYCFSLEGIH